MTKRVLLLGCFLASFSPASLDAAEKISAPDFAVDGSIPLQFMSNAKRSESDRQSDYVFSPYLRLSGSGELTKDVSYSVYASTGADKFFKLEDSDVSLAAFGTQATERFGSLRLGGSYERNYYYDGVFGSEIRTANDFKLFLRYNYSDPAGNIRIRPSMSATVRLGDDLNVQRNLYRFKIDFERKLIDRWWVVATPSLRVYQYVDQQSGRLDDIYSITTGLRHEIAKDVSLTSSIGYESRVSSAHNRNFTNFVAGLSLDFSYDLLDLNKNADHLRQPTELPKCVEVLQESC